MLIDVIGSKVFRKVSEFKNFPFYINNFSIDQSLLSLMSEPLPTSMKKIDTSDLTDITIAYRDLNKGQWEQFQNSNSEALIIDLLGELRTVSEYRGSYYSSHSLNYLNDIHDYKLSRVEQFRKLLNILDNEFIDFANGYEKVFLIKIHPTNIEDAEFIDALYNIIETKLNNKIVINIFTENIGNIFDGPIEFYHEINTMLKRYVSSTYETQLLFDEKLVDGKISVYMNYLGDRTYIYELLKDGRPIITTDKTKNRKFEYVLKEPGKYRIRVNVVDADIKPRLSKTYEFNPNISLDNHPSYLELPDSESMWMIDILINELEVEGLVGDPFKYPYGYQSNPVLHKSEVSTPYIKSIQLLTLLLENIQHMDHVAFTQLINKYDADDNQTVIAFIKYLKTQR